MAAYVCTGIFNCCTGMCEGCSKCCGGACESCGKGCARGCEGLGDICCGSKPFPFCASFTCCVQFLPMFIFFIFGIIELISPTCVAPIGAFLIVCGVVALINTMFSFYLYWRFSIKTEEKDVSCQRAAKILCYDPVVCVYFFIWVFTLVWSIVGIVWVQRGCGGASNAVSIIAIVLNFIFLWFGIIIAILSVCCQCCKEGLQKIQKKIMS